jgi:hypothetical protein
MGIDKTHKSIDLTDGTGNGDMAFELSQLGWAAASLRQGKALF